MESTRRKFIVTTGMVAAAGCTSIRSSSEDNNSWYSSRTSDSLDFYTWQDYWGGQALSFQHVGDIDNISKEQMSSNDQLRRLQNGDHPDVVHLFTQEFIRAKDEQLLRPLPVDSLSSWPPDVDLRAQNLDLYATEESYYGYPQSPVAMSLAYRWNNIEKPDSWSELWKKKHAGQISMPANPVRLGQIGALYTGQDPNNPSDIAKIRYALQEQSNLVDTYWSDWFNAWQQFSSGDIDFAVLPQPRMCLCAQDETPIRYSSPNEGVIYSQSTLAIPADASNPNIAADFIDWASGFKSGTEIGWNADEWTLHKDRLADGIREEYNSIGEDLLPSSK